LWTVPGGKPGADQAKFTSTKTELALGRVAGQHQGPRRHGGQGGAHQARDGVFDRGSRDPGQSGREARGHGESEEGGCVLGHYYVTEANHFYDAAGYNCIFYVARDKWGDSSSDKEKDKQDDQNNQGGGGTGGPYTPPKPPDTTDKKEPVDFTIEDDDGKPLSDLQVKIHLSDGTVIEATTDGSGKVHLDDKPAGPYTVEILGAGAALTSIDIKVEDAAGNPISARRARSS